MYLRTFVPRRESNQTHSTPVSYSTPKSLIPLKHWLWLWILNRVVGLPSRQEFLGQALSGLVAEIIYSWMRGFWVRIPASSSPVSFFPHDLVGGGGGGGGTQNNNNANLFFSKSLRKPLLASRQIYIKINLLHTFIYQKWGPPFEIMYIVLGSSVLTFLLTRFWISHSIKYSPWAHSNLSVTRWSRHPLELRKTVRNSFNWRDP